MADPDLEPYFSSGSSYNEAMDFDEEHEYEDESEEVVLEEELPHEDDEYFESDSYEYPYPTSSDDSWAELSSDEAIQKIIEKLPTYSSESSNDERPPSPPPLDPASDSDAGSFVEHNEEKEDKTDIAPSQLHTYQPISYLQSVETYNIYIVSHSDSDADDESLSVALTPLPNTPLPTTPQGQAQPDPPHPEPDLDDNKDDTETQRNEPTKTVSFDEDDKETTQSEILVIAEDAVMETDIKEEFQPVEVRHRGRDAPRKMTKTRIIIKKVKAKRGPKRFKEGMKVQVKDDMKYGGVVGHIRFVGLIEDHKMVGIEMLDNAIEGDTDGIYKDERYFECEEKKGVFLSINNIAKYIDKEKRKQSNEFKKKSRERRRYLRNNAQMYGNIVDNLWQQRIDLVRSKNYRVVHKAGPREFGRIEYFGGDDEYTNALNDGAHFLAPRLHVPRRSKQKAKPKAGPRDVGRKESYVGIEYNEEEERKKRAKKKQLMEEHKRRQFEQARKKKLEEGRITRADGSYEKGSTIKIKGKKSSKPLRKKDVINMKEKRSKSVDKDKKEKKDKKNSSLTGKNKDKRKNSSLKGKDKDKKDKDKDKKNGGKKKKNSTLKGKSKDKKKNSSLKAKGKDKKNKKDSTDNKSGKKVKKTSDIKKNKKKTKNSSLKGKNKGSSGK